MKTLAYLTLGLLLGMQLDRTTSRHPSSPPPSSESIEMAGVELHLGMSKADIIPRMVRNGYATTGEGNSLNIVQKHGEGEAVSFIGNLGFKDDRLDFINRDWAPDAQLGNQDGPVIALGLYGALSEAQRQGRTICVMSTNSHQTPSSEVKAIFLTCGPSRKTIELLLTRWGGQDFVSVAEILKPGSPYFRCSCLP